MIHELVDLLWAKCRSILNLHCSFSCMCGWSADSLNSFPKFSFYSIFSDLHIFTNLKFIFSLNFFSKMAIPRIELPVELLAEVFLAVQLTPEFVGSLGFSSESARLLLLCQCANEFAGRPFRRILALRQQIFQAPCSWHFYDFKMLFPY